MDSMERKHIVWNAENINRLQDFLASKPNDEKIYFGYQVGEAIVYFCGFFVKNFENCKVLDYGCGMGHIMKCFIDKGINVWGVDMSTEAINATYKRCEGSAFFHGVKMFNGDILPYETSYFDLVTCTECVEHILPEHMDLFLNELLRVLKPGGRILFTTNNEENFALSELCCPECNTIYHKVGHVNWYSVEKLTELMENHGYITVMCHGTDFWQFLNFIKHPPLLDMSLRRIIRQIKRTFIRITDNHKGTTDSKVFQINMNLKREPHLFYVGTKL